jgi:putative transposase
VERSDTHHVTQSKVMGFASLYPSYGSELPGYPSRHSCGHVHMTGYRRNFIAGGCFFFTVNLADRRLRLLTEYVDELRTAFRETRRSHSFTTEAMVVLPDHLHTVWTLPEGDADFATR